MHHHDHSSNRLRAFTLIELLVAITIIGILVSLLLPAISSVRSAAKKTDCMNRQRQLSVTMLRYVGDHKGSFPFYTNSDGSGSEKKMWYNIISDDWNRASAAGMNSFDPSLIRNFFCSEDPHQRPSLAPNPIYGAAGNEWTYMQVKHYISIGYNKFGLGERRFNASGVEEYNGTFNRGGTPWDPNNPTGMARLGEISNPSEKIMIGDTMIGLNPSTGLPNTATPSGINSEKYGMANLYYKPGHEGIFYPRHNRGRMANLACVDGRVISIKANKPYDADDLYRNVTQGGVGTGKNVGVLPASPMWNDRNP